MSNITSPWMSTANIGDWDYYIFTENNSVVQVMNGLAAWFNGSGGGLVQGAALLGGLVLLMYALFGAATRSNKTSPFVIGVWALLVASVGITGRAVVTNVYTGQVSVVANVPALALVPASIFSKAGYRIFEDIDQAYQTTSGSYMSVGQWGFVGPLDVLLALRSNKAPALIGPEAYKSLKQVLTDCGTDPANTPPAGFMLENSVDALNYLMQYGRKTGLTMVYPSATDSTGQIESCGDAFVWLNNKFSAMASGSALSKLNAASLLPNPQGNNGVWGANATTEAFDLLMAGAIGSSQNSIEYTKNALVASYITYSQQCFSSNNAIVNPRECENAALAVGEGLESWKTGAAAGGQGFLKTMFTSMGFLQVMFFSFFPFVIVYAVATGMQAAKVVGGYIFFGIWTQSWVIVVAPIQSYIQNNVIEIARKTTSGEGLTIANANALYERLSTQLAVASDMMASAQMVSLALISGSIYAMVGMANKWSGATSMNTNSLQKDLNHEAALNKETALNNTQFLASTQSGIYNQGNFAQTSQEGVMGVQVSTSRASTANRGSGSSLERGSTETLTQGLASSLESSLGSSVNSKFVAQASETAKASYDAFASINTSMLNALSNSGLFKGMNAQQRAQAESTISSQAQAAFTAHEKQNPGWFKNFVAGNADAIETGADIVSGLAAVGTIGGATLAGGPVGGAVAAAPSQMVRQAAKEGLKQWLGSVKQEVRESIATAASRPGSQGGTGGGTAQQSGGQRAAGMAGKGYVAAETIGMIFGGVNQGLQAGANAVFGSEFATSTTASSTVSQDEQNKIAVTASQAAQKANAFASKESFSSSQGVALVNQMAFVQDPRQMAAHFAANPADMAALRSQAAEAQAMQGTNTWADKAAMRMTENAMRGVSHTGAVGASVSQAIRDSIYLTHLGHQLNLGFGGGPSAFGPVGSAPVDFDPLANEGLSANNLRMQGASPGNSSKVATPSMTDGFDPAIGRAVQNNGDRATSLTSTNAVNELHNTNGQYVGGVIEDHEKMQTVVAVGAGFSAISNALGKDKDGMNAFKQNQTSGSKQSEN